MKASLTTPEGLCWVYFLVFYLHSISSICHPSRYITWQKFWDDLICFFPCLLLGEQRVASLSIKSCGFDIQ